MSRGRLDLHEMLCSIMEPYVTDKDRRVYFRAPTNSSMKYPCIRYDCTRIATKSADNIRYIRNKSYTVTVIDHNPDSEIPDKILDLPLSVSSDRNYEMDGLNHFVFTLYY